MVDWKPKPGYGDPSDPVRRGAGASPKPSPAPVGPAPITPNSRPAPPLPPVKR